MAKEGPKWQEFVRPFVVEDGKKFRLKDLDPGETLGLNHLEDAKNRADELLQAGIEHLRDMQAKLYAQDRWALLLIFQAMDAAGRDSVIKHVPHGDETCPLDRRPGGQQVVHPFGRSGHRNRDPGKLTAVIPPGGRREARRVAGSTGHS